VLVYPVSPEVSFFPASRELSPFDALDLVFVIVGTDVFPLTLVAFLLQDRGETSANPLLGCWMRSRRLLFLAS